jgi:hypothetical protein
MVRAFGSTQAVRFRTVVVPFINQIIAYLNFNFFTKSLQYWRLQMSSTDSSGINLTISSRMNLKSTGAINQVMSAVAYDTTWNSASALWPLPETALAANAVLVQNSEYGTLSNKSPPKISTRESRQHPVPIYFLPRNSRVQDLIIFPK